MALRTPRPSSATGVLAGVGPVPEWNQTFLVAPFCFGWGEAFRKGRCGSQLFPHSGLDRFHMC